MRSRAESAAARWQSNPDPSDRRELDSLGERLDAAFSVARNSLRDYFLLLDSNAPLEGRYRPGV